MRIQEFCDHEDHRRLGRYLVKNICIEREQRAGKNIHPVFEIVAGRKAARSGNARDRYRLGCLVTL